MVTAEHNMDCGPFSVWSQMPRKPAQQRGRPKLSSAGEGLGHAEEAQRTQQAQEEAPEPPNSARSWASTVDEAVQ